MTATRGAGLRIGELSRRARCNIETIRYYERIGLLPAPARSAARYRLYGVGDIRRLAFIRRARELGFAIQDIRALSALSADDGHGACEQARTIAAHHLAVVRAKLADLRMLEQILAAAVARCDAGRSPECPIIDTLADEPGPRMKG